MKTEKRFFVVSPNELLMPRTRAEAVSDRADISMGKTLKEELENLVPMIGEEYDVYEVTFKKVKRIRFVKKKKFEAIK